MSQIDAVDPSSNTTLNATGRAVGSTQQHGGAAVGQHLAQVADGEPLVGRPEQVQAGTLRLGGVQDLA